MRYILSVLILAGTFAANAQVLTREDSLNAGLVASDRATVISGYGEAKVTYDLRGKTGEANLTRNVLFIGHKFNNRISLFSEMELEDAKVEGGEPGGELAMEQLFVKFNVTNSVYISAGLVIPRIGIINENHLPTTFNGNSRPYVERLVIPSTWREIGVVAYGQPRSISGLNWSFGILNGLNSAEFGNGKGIRGGRFEGKEATASNIAMTGSLLYYMNDFRFQVSGYYGGSAGLSPADADTLNLNAGALGTPVILGEADVQYFGKGFGFKLLGSAVSVPEANAINTAYGNNVGELMWGGYAEVSYNLFSALAIENKFMNLFVRYEILDLHAAMSENGIKDDYLNQNYLVAGITYMPVRGVAVKFDYTQQTTGDKNVLIHGVSTGPFYNSNGFASLGIAYSF